jgi:hypothetical protein
MKAKSLFKHMMASALIAGGMMTTVGATTYTATWGTAPWT